MKGKRESNFESPYDPRSWLNKEIDRPQKLNRVTVVIDVMSSQILQKCQ